MSETEFAQKNRKSLKKPIFACQISKFSKSSNNYHLVIKIKTLMITIYIWRIWIVYLDHKQFLKYLFFDIYYITSLKIS